MRTKDPDKQHRIKEALVQMILTEGIQGTSVSKIAKAAQVSPATIYVYYESKEEMLAEVFREYSHQSYHYLMGRIRPQMTGAELIESIVRGYFDYTVCHEDVFSFVEQCSRCPTLMEMVCEEECCCDVFGLIHEYQRRGEIRTYSDTVMSALLLSPVRFLASGKKVQDMDQTLTELVGALTELLVAK